jgi:hypothetical protein
LCSVLILTSILSKVKKKKFRKAETIKPYPIYELIAEDQDNQTAMLEEEKVKNSERL